MCKHYAILRLCGFSVQSRNWCNFIFRITKLCNAISRLCIFPNCEEQSHHFIFTLSSPLQVNPPPSSQTPAPDTSSLPTTAPPQRVLLWLSNHLVKWRFFARYLGVEDHIIDRIEAENQGDIREQCYQMLSTSKQQNPDSFTCRNIGLALLESENNRKLLGEYCNQVLNQ